MKTYQTTFQLTELLKDFPYNIPRELFFADIETTGLSSSKNKIYCIGTAQIRKNSGQIVQFFAEQSEEEPEILKQFSDFFLTDPDRHIITYNGASFDLPFLKQRYAYWNIPFPLEHTKHTDLYQQSRRLQPLLQLNYMKQKDLELFLNINRDDRYNGGELIRIYKKYEKTKDPELLQLLKLHNLDDMKGLCALTAIKPYIELTEGKFTINHIDFFEEQNNLFASFEIAFENPLVSSITKVAENGVLIALRSKTGIIRLPVFHTTLKLFLTDYKNYFYLPQEHTVIHKSVGQFVDSAHRIPATRENCFLQKEGFFIEVSERLRKKGPKNLFFKQSYHSQSYFLDISGLWKKNQKVLVSELSPRELDILHPIIQDILNRTS